MMIVTFRPTDASKALRMTRTGYQILWAIFLLVIFGSIGIYAALTMNLIRPRA